MKEKTVMVGTRVTTDIEQRLRQESVKTGLTTSRIIANAIAKYFGDEITPSPSERLHELETIVARLNGKISSMTQTEATTIAQPKPAIAPIQPAEPENQYLNEAELLSKFGIPANWRSRIPGWQGERWIYTKTGCTHLKDDLYRCPIKPQAEGVENG